MKAEQLIIFLFFCFGSMVILDSLLTSQALNQGGYYEYNDFTNAFGLTAHALILLCFGFICAQAGIKNENLKKPSIIVLSAVTMVWAFNNAYSVVLLW